MKSYSLVQQIGFWFFLLFSIVILTQNELTWAGALQRSLIMGCVYAVNFYMCFLLLTPRFFESKRYTEFVIYMLAMHLALTLVRYHIDSNFFHRFL